jgi:hypothetical protein
MNRATRTVLESVVARLHLNEETRSSSLEGVRYQQRRVGKRMGFELLTDKEVTLTDFEKNWILKPTALKKNQFARVEVEERILDGELRAPEFGAVLATSSAKKSAPSKRTGHEGLSLVQSIAGAVVGKDFQQKGYGLLLFLAALQWASSKGYWLTSDFQFSDTAAAQATWQTLQSYAQQTFTGKYRVTVLPPVTDQPLYAAYGLNAAGAALLEPLLAAQ